MKVTCPSCQSKYTIADDKVQNRSVKIKCRKCGETIQAGTPSADGGVGQPTIYSVLVGEGDQRDMSLAEIVAAHRAGTIHNGTFVWADGQPDWLPIEKIAAITDALAGAPAKGSAAEPVKKQVPGSSPGSQPGVARATPGPGASDQASVKEGRRGRGIDLFGRGSRPVQTEEEVATSAPNVAGAPGGKAAGARDDSSVLFSLGALTSAPAAERLQLGAAKGGDSGLIDLRALADKADKKTEKAVAAKGPVAILDAAPILGAPLLALPADEAEPRTKKSTMPMFIGIGIAVAGLAIAAAFVLTSKQGDRVPEIPSALVTAATTQVSAAITATSTDTSGAAPPATGAPSASAKPVAKGGGGAKGGGAKGGAGKKEEPGGGEPAPPKPAPPRSKCGCAPNDLACNMACAAK